MIENDLKDFIIAGKVIRSYRGTKSRVVIPNGIIGIGPGAFYQNDNITSVIMPDSVVSVSKKAFSMCSNLRSVRFSANLKRIELEAFSYCLALSNITLYSGLEVVRAKAFSGCHNIKNIYLPDTLKEIGKESFVNYNSNCIIHTPSDSKAAEYALNNGFEIDQKNPPARNADPVQPNENNHKDPKAIRFFETGNYGIDEDVNDEETSKVEEEKVFATQKIHHKTSNNDNFSTIHTDTTETVSIVNDDITEVVEEKKPEESKKEKIEKEIPVKKTLNKKPKRKVNTAKIKKISGYVLSLMLVVLIIGLVVKFLVTYVHELGEADEALPSNELIIPFNMAYNYAALKDSNNFLKQIEYLGLDTDSDFGTQINIEFTNEYLKNGSLEGMLKRFAAIYTYGVSLEGFSETAALQSLGLVIDNMMIAVDDDSLINTVSVTYRSSESVIKETPVFYCELNNTDFYFGLCLDENNHYVFYFIQNQAARYEKAMDYYKNTEYAQAQVIFEELTGYKDSDDMLISSKYYNAVDQYESQNYTAAYTLLADVVAEKGTTESVQLLEEVKERLYEQGMEYYNASQFDESNAIFAMLGSYKNCSTLLHTHEYTETVQIKATCVSTGLLKKACDCGKVVYETIPLADHEYESYVSIEPTCIKEGVRTYVCKNCGHTYTEKIATIPHDYIEATCTLPKICSVCGHEEGEPLGHSYSNSTICNRCGYDYAENIRVIADCLPFDVSGYLWGDNYYIVSCTHSVVYNASAERMDLIINWRNSETSAFGYGSITSSLVACIYDQDGNLIKKDSNLYFSKGEATTYVYGVSDNTEYYVTMELYIKGKKVK